jgi:chemotaxis protein CheZ
MNTISAPRNDSDTTTAMYQRVGQLTRVLHDALRELGYDRELSAAANSLPDARDRLSYIASLTGQAANRVLSAVENGQAQQDALEGDARELAERWARTDQYKASPDELAALVGATRAFVDGVPQRTTATRELLLDIMMAQDFHDLTGQVIKRVGEVAQRLESSLLLLLLETRRPPETAPIEPSLSGPAVRPSADTLANQGEVDRLLESLGF